MRHALTPIVGLMLLQACAVEQQAPVIVVTATKPIVLPVECTSTDEVWHELPDADIKRSEAARHDRINKDRYAKLIGKRRVCRAAILTIGQPK